MILAVYALNINAHHASKRPHHELNEENLSMTHLSRKWAMLQVSLYIKILLWRPKLVMKSKRWRTCFTTKMIRSSYYSTSVQTNNQDSEFNEWIRSSPSSYPSYIWPAHRNRRVIGPSSDRSHS